MRAPSLRSSRVVKQIATTAVAAGAALLPFVAFGQVDPGLNIVQNSIDLGSKDVRETVAQIINVAIGLLGIVAVVIILSGGFMWMTAGGNEDRVEKAKHLIFSGIIGLAIILAAFAIAKFVINSLVTATAN